MRHDNSSHLAAPRAILADARARQLTEADYTGRFATAARIARAATKAAISWRAAAPHPRY